MYESYIKLYSSTVYTLFRGDGYTVSWQAYTYIYIYIGQTLTMPHIENLSLAGMGGYELLSKTEASQSLYFLTKQRE